MTPIGGSSSSATVWIPEGHGRAHGPGPEPLRSVDAQPSLRQTRSHMAAYIGVMGPQDGVDLVLELADMSCTNSGVATSVSP